MSRYQLHWDPVDPLGEALHTLHLTGTFYCRSELTEPWGLAMPAMPGCVWFHVFLSGRCELAVDSLAPVALVAGGFALITKGQGHVLRTGKQAYEIIRSLMLKANHTADQRICLDSFASLNSDWMQSTLQLMAFEARQQSAGGETNVLDLPHEMAGERYALLLYGGRGAARHASRRHPRDSGNPFVALAGSGRKNGMVRCTAGPSGRPRPRHDSSRTGQQLDR